MDNFYLLFPTLFTLLVPLPIGWLLDRWLGDPLWLPHPVVGFGKIISACEQRLNKGKNRRLKGGVMSILLVVVVFLLTYYLLRGVSPFLPLLILVQAVLIFYCLAGTTLLREVKAVFGALNRSTEEGRRQVARIVGRDTEELSSQEVRTAALETLAENLSDGVIAPLFWYLLLDLPGMVAYKMVNTLDSMIGYRNERYLCFGRVAARMDDAANYLPARLTAFLMLWVQHRISLLSFVKKYGKNHLSPNSGYPEAALAALLDCRFGGPHNYFGRQVWKPYIGQNNRLLTEEDLKVAVRINRRAETLMILLILVVKIGIFLLFFV